MDTFTATVTRVTDLTHNVREVALRLVQPDHIDFRAGQFISFHIDRPGSRFGVTRAFTIASPPDNGRELLLLLDRVPEGRGSGYLYGLNAGDTTSFRGPFGNFHLGDHDRDLLLVANGTGIAPFRSMLWWLAGHVPHRKVSLLWGLRTQQDIYYAHDFVKLREHMRHFEARITLLEPPADWDGARGSIAALVDSEIARVDNLEVFICGSSAMVTEVASIIRRKGDCPVRKEPYYAATT